MLWLGRGDRDEPCILVPDHLKTKRMGLCNLWVDWLRAILPDHHLQSLHR